MEGQASFLTQLLEHLTNEEALIWEVLQEHRGKENAITHDQIAEQTCLDKRLVRDRIKALTEEHRKPIGSLSGKGVFLITSLEERQEVLDFYRGHSLSLLRRMAILSGYNTQYLLGQLEIDLTRLLAAPAEESNGVKS